MGRGLDRTEVGQMRALVSTSAARTGNGFDKLGPNGLGLGLGWEWEWSGEWEWEGGQGLDAGRSVHPPPRSP